MPGAPALPPETLRALKPLIRVALNLDPTDDRPPASARATLSPLTRAVLSTEPLERPPWYRTLPSDPRRVADVVHRVLDELDALAGGAHAPQPTLTRTPTSE